MNPKTGYEDILLSMKTANGLQKTLYIRRYESGSYSLVTWVISVDKREETFEETYVERLTNKQAKVFEKYYFDWVR